MIKLFCDICSSEITDKNNLQPLKKSWGGVATDDYNRDDTNKDCLGTYFGPSTGPRGRGAFYIYAGFAGDRRETPHICRYCIFDAFKSIDDREKAVIPTPPTVEDHG